MAKKLTNVYLSSICREMAMLLQSGITIDMAITMMLDDEPNKDSKIVLKDLLDHLDGGNPLSVAMRNGKYFPGYMVSMIELGEQSGRITEVLNALSEHYDRQDRLLLSIKNATLYPAILLCMMIVVVIVLITRVLPIFNDVFGRMGAQMSPLAFQLMQLGAWLRGASLAIAVVLGILVVAGLAAWFITAVREAIIRKLRASFGSRGIYGRIATFQIMSAMTLAMSSGMGLEESLKLISTLHEDSKVLGKKYEMCMAAVREGSSLAVALRNSEILSARDSRMLSIGESSGVADATMGEIARRNDRMIQDEIATIVGRIEPTLVIITSVIVGMILFSVMLPLIEIMTAIG